MVERGSARSAALLVVVLLLVAACGGPAQPVEVTIGTPANSDEVFVPASASVPTGRTVRLEFVNSSDVQHNLSFDAPIDAATADSVEPGASDELEFTAPAPGDYEFFCTIHPGMAGTLTVTP